MKSRTGQKLKLTTVEELLGVPNEEASTEIDICRIHDFKNHPFKVLDDEKMIDLVESIRANGVLSPVLVRPDGEDHYEMVSGHRRMHAAKIVGLEMIPAIVREMSDDEAVVYMVDSNIQREELLPSEKAFAYKMKLDAMKRQGKRNDLTSSQNETKLRSDSELSKQVGESRAQIQRYIRLTELVPELLDMVDQKRLNFTIAVDISYIDQEIQKWLYEYIRENGFIKPNQISTLRKYAESEPMTQNKMIQILNSCISLKGIAQKITLNEKKLRKYFPPYYSTADMEQVIEQLLEAWKQDQEGSKDVE